MGKGLVVKNIQKLGYILFMGSAYRGFKKKIMEFSIKLAWWVLDALFVIKKQTKKLGLKTFYRAF